MTLIAVAAAAVSVWPSAVVIEEKLHGEIAVAAAKATGLVEVLVGWSLVDAGLAGLVKKSTVAPVLALLVGMLKAMLNRKWYLLLD